MKATFHSSTRAIRLHTALAAVACGIAMTTTATADPGNAEPLMQVVSYADLNLNTEPGAQTLYGRLRMASIQVCAPFRRNSLRERTNWSQCFNPALARAVAQINEPVLTAYHLNQTVKAEQQSRVVKDQ